MKKYTEKERTDYWEARCLDCGWHGLTCDCTGFGPIGDTGDYDDGYCPRCSGVVEGEDDPYGLRIRLLWAWRALTFWVQRKRRRERLEEEAFVRDFKPYA